MVNSKTLIFCTSVQWDTDYYSNRVYKWGKYCVKRFNSVDLLVVVDGVWDNSCHDFTVGTLNNTPKLGRKSCWVFPGWKRSFYQALKYSIANNYEQVMLLENDMYIINDDKVEYYLNQKGSFCAYDHKYKFVEPSLMILNDIDIRKFLCDRYKTKESWYENIDFEETLSKLNLFKPVFDSYRVENDVVTDKMLNDYDALGQYCGSNSFSSK